MKEGGGEDPRQVPVLQLWSIEGHEDCRCTFFIFDYQPSQLMIRELPI